MKKITDWSAIFSIAGKICFLFAVAFMLSPSSVEAQCGQWDLSGNWNIVLVNGPSESLKNLTQSLSDYQGTDPSAPQVFRISGKAFIKSSYNYNPNNPNQSEGKVFGTGQGDQVLIDIEWSSPYEATRTLHEAFKGTIALDGKLEGQATIQALAGLVTLKWSSDRPMKCLYKTVHRLGTKPTTPTTPTAVIAPTITASQPIPVTGQVVLEWDGGKDHPYAELWVKVDDGDETFVVEQGKGTRQVTVEPGKTYLYILADAGERLATVTVKSRQ